MKGIPSTKQVLINISCRFNLAACKKDISIARLIINKLIREWESSGLSQEKFLSQHKIAKSTFGYWRKKYLAEHSSSSRKEAFIPVKISIDENPADNTGTIEVIYPNGVRLLCPERIDLSRLKALIA